MSTVTGEQGTDDMVRVEVEVTGSFDVFLTQDEYEAWQGGDAAAQRRVAQLLVNGREQERQDGELDHRLKRAVLVEADGYLGTDIAVLKSF